jgi:hypothetical protein
VLSRVVVASPEHSLSLYGVIPAVTPWIAPEQAPHRKNEASKYAVLTDCLYRVP